MTSMSLHAPPRWRAVAAEQIRAVGLLTRNAGIVLLTLIAIGCGIVTWTAMILHDREVRHVGAATWTIALEPWHAGIFAGLALLYPFAVWEGDDPNRRGYHWMMPVPHNVHAMTKALAGWLWALAATGTGLLAVVLMSAVSAQITGRPSSLSQPDWWIWLVPFTSVTLAYVVASAATIGAQRPFLWLGGALLLYWTVLGTVHTLGYRDAERLMASIGTGRYGLLAAGAGQIDWVDSATLRVVPSVSRWLGAFALWLVPSAALLVVVSSRRDVTSWASGGGPSERAPGVLTRYRYLIAATIVIALAGGVVATRVVKPEYEARATIWLNSAPAPSGPVPTPRQPGVDVSSVVASRTVLLPVVREFGLYTTSHTKGAEPMLRSLSLAGRFIPGDYTLSVDAQGKRWLLSLYLGRQEHGQGVVGDSIGREVGLLWQPEAAAFAPFAGGDISFSIATPVEAEQELASRLIATRTGTNFLALSLTGVDPERAAHTLNAIARGYVAHMRDSTRVPMSVLDSAVVPLSPFKNSAPRLMFVALVIGAVAGVGIAYALGASAARARR